MLFKNFIYLNECLLQRLAKQLEMPISHEYTSTSQTTKRAGIAINPLSAGHEKMETNTQTLEKDKYDLFKIFERKISDDETGIIEFDFNEAEHIFSGQLIRFSAIMKQPKGIDENIELINSIKQNPIFSELINESIVKENADNAKLLNMLFSSQKSVPVYFSNEENYIVFSNINNDYLDISYEDFQDLYDEEVKVRLHLKCYFSFNFNILKF